MNETFYRITAFFILAVFYGCYLLKKLLQKRKGIRTDQMGRGKTGFVKVVELTMKTMATLMPAAELLSIFLLKKMPPAPVRIAGIVIGLLGDAFFVLAAVTMKDNWRAGVPESDRTELVTEGIYQISRNPAFVGFDLTYIGFLCMYFNWYLFILSFIAVAVFHLQIVNVEEEYLHSTFGEAYLNYKKQVNRYLGRK